MDGLKFYEVIIMNTIRTRKRGKTFSYIFEAGKTADGKRHVVEKGGSPSKEAAYEAGVLAYADWKNGNIGVTSKSILLKDYFSKWLDVIKNDIRPATFSTYRHNSQRISKYIGGIALNKLRPRDVDNMLRQLRDEGTPRHSLQQLKSVLHNALAYAVYPAEIIPYNVADTVKLPRAKVDKSVDRKVISYDDFQRLMEKHPFGHDYHIFLHLAYYTGMRLGEILGLTWDNVDLVNARLYVRQQIRYSPGIGRTVSPPKTKTSVRTIALDAQTVALLGEWQCTQSLNELVAGDAYICIYADENGKVSTYSKAFAPPSSHRRLNLVITRENGKPLDNNYLGHYLKTLGINAHSFRHTHATLLIENGATAKDVAARLGHSKTDITQDLYTHDTETMQKQTVAILDKISGSEKQPNSPNHLT